jgi:hypothetical protein
MNEEPLDERSEGQFSKIKKLHLAAAIFFLIQTIAYFAADAEANVEPSIGVQIEGVEGPMPGTEQKNLGTTNIIWLIPLFTLLACVDHFVSYYFLQSYENMARKWLFVIGSNPFRWIEYSISASVMTLALTILCGVTDVHIWFANFFMTAIGMGFGQVLELIPKQEIPELQIKYSTLRELVHWLATTLIFAPWLIMLCYFFQAADSDMPDFVYAAFLGTLLMFATFGINSYLHNNLGKYNFATAEIIYIVLSFTSKTFLAADVFGGLRASEDE